MGKIIKDTPSVYDPPPYSAKEQQSDFKKEYEFREAPPVRSPVKGYEYGYIKNPSEYSRVPAAESRLVKGTPHTFKGVRTNNSYGSRQAVRRTTRGK